MVCDTIYTYTARILFRGLWQTVESIITLPATFRILTRIRTFRKMLNGRLKRSNNREFEPSVLGAIVRNKFNIVTCYPEKFKYHFTRYSQHRESNVTFPLRCFIFNTIKVAEKGTDKLDKSFFATIIKIFNSRGSLRTCFPRLPSWKFYNLYIFSRITTIAWIFCCYIAVKIRGKRASRRKLRAFCAYIAML